MNLNKSRQCLCLWRVLPFFTPTSACRHKLYHGVGASELLPVSSAAKFDALALLELAKNHNAEVPACFPLNIDAIYQTVDNMGADEVAATIELMLWAQQRNAVSTEVLATVLCVLCSQAMEPGVLQAMSALQAVQVLIGLRAAGLQGHNLRLPLLQHLSQPHVMAQLSPVELTAVLSHTLATGKPPADLLDAVDEFVSHSNTYSGCTLEDILPLVSILAKLNLRPTSRGLLCRCFDCNPDLSFVPKGLLLDAVFLADSLGVRSQDWYKHLVALVCHGSHVAVLPLPQLLCLGTVCVATGLRVEAIVAAMHKQMQGESLTSRQPPELIGALYLLLHVNDDDPLVDDVLASLWSSPVVGRIASPTDAARFLWCMAALDVSDRDLISPLASLVTDRASLLLSSSEVVDVLTLLGKVHVPCDVLAATFCDALQRADGRVGWPAGTYAKAFLLTARLGLLHLTEALQRVADEMLEREVFSALSISELAGVVHVLTKLKPPHLALQARVAAEVHQRTVAAAGTPSPPSSPSLLPSFARYLLDHRLPFSLSPSDLAALLPALRSAGLRDTTLATQLEERVAALTNEGSLSSQQAAAWSFALQMLKPPPAVEPCQ